MFKPVSVFCWPFQGGASCVNPFCYLRFMFIWLSCLFLAALWSPAGKELIRVVFSCFFFYLSHMVLWVRYGTWMYRFLIFTFLSAFIFLLYSKTCVKRPLLKDQKLVFKTNYRLMQVKSIAECSKGSILQYFRPSLSYHLSLRHLFCLFKSGRFMQILLYLNYRNYR